MGLLARLLNPPEERGALIGGGSLQEPQAWLVDLLGGLPTGSGMRVTPDTAIGVVAIFAAVKLIASSLAFLPLVVYRKLPKGAKARDESHPLFELLHDQPNSWQTSQDFREMMCGHQVLRGNAYAYIQPGGPAGVQALIPLDPRRMNPFRWLLPPQFIDGPIYYRYQPYTGPQIIFRQEEIFHLRGFSSDGFTGLSPIQVHREAVGLAMAQEATAANFTRNGLRPSGALMHPSQLKKEARENLRKSMEELHSGAANAGRPIILEEGLKWEKMGMTPEDAQYVAARTFQVSEVARMFQVPPHMLAELTRSTNNNIEEQGQEFLTYCLLQWLVRWEQCIRMQLVTLADRKTHDVAFMLDSLIRGDFKTRMAGYQVGRQWGFYSINDIRGFEGLNPLDGPEGDVYMAPLNMVNAEKLLDEPDADEDTPTPAPDTADPEAAPGTAPQPGANAAPLLIERRDYVAARKALRKSYRRLYEDAAGRVVRRETKAIRGLMKSHLDKRGLHEFNGALDALYASHADTVQKALAPAHLTYAEAVAGEVAGELGIEPGTVIDSLAPLMDRHGAAQAARHVQDSRSQLRETIAAQQADLVPALNELMDKWDSERHASIAAREVVATEGHVARAMIADAGRLAVWRAGETECPACQAMDGKIAAGQEPFLRVGMHLHDTAGNTLFAAKRVVPHAPLHNGCNCSIEAQK